jgi:hypothetical protein
MSTAKNPQIATQQAARTGERYTKQLAKTSEYLLRKHGKSNADRQHDMKRIAACSIDLNAGFMLDNGSHPWDAVQ